MCFLSKKEMWSRESTMAQCFSENKLVRLVKSILAKNDFLEIYFPTNLRKGSKKIFAAFLFCFFGARRLSPELKIQPWTNEWGLPLFLNPNLKWSSFSKIIQIQILCSLFLLKFFKRKDWRRTPRPRSFDSKVEMIFHLHQTNQTACNWRNRNLL